MAEELGAVEGASTSSKRRRRRRRRKEEERDARRVTELSDDVLQVGEGAPRPHTAEAGKGRRKRSSDLDPVNLPASGRNPFRKRPSRPRRAAPGSAHARRRRLSRAELDKIGDWLRRLPDNVVAALYRGLGGQPNRVSSMDRMIQLTTRALGQPSRIATLVKQLSERDRKALSALLQAGGVAHAEELIRELTLSFGGHERDWRKVMLHLANRGVVLASSEQDGQFFYIVPEPMVPGLLTELADELSLPVFRNSDVRVLDAKPFCPPLGFSVISLATYIDQHSPRLTQRHEIYRHDKEEMDAFFAQIWDSDSELFGFHLDFLMMHGLVELRGEYLALNRDVMDEFLGLEAEDQRDLLFRALDRRFPMAEWVLWSIHAAAGDDPEAWVAERPLVALYRRWKRGADWRERLESGRYRAGRSHERESYSFAPLVRAGILDMGQWGQEKFYRLSARGRQLLEPDEDDGFQQFYLTPSFEIMAPAGLAPVLLYRIGELAELVGCDRANTYKITEQSIERALDRGWRRDEVLQFLRDNSQIGLPDNVEATLKGWIGHRGDVEFHDLMLMTVHRSQIKRLESNKRIKPYLLHRFAPGMYAVDRHKRDEIVELLTASRFSPARDVRNYPGDPEQIDARQNLHRLLAEARQEAGEPIARGTGVIDPEQLHLVPGAKAAGGPIQREEPVLPPEVDLAQARMIIERALSKDLELEMVYHARNGNRLALRVQPERMAYRGGAAILVGTDLSENEARSFVLDKIERLRAVEPDAGDAGGEE